MSISSLTYTSDISDNLITEGPIDQRGFFSSPPLSNERTIETYSCDSTSVGSAEEDLTISAIPERPANREKFSRIFQALSTTTQNSFRSFYNRFPQDIERTPFIPNFLKLLGELRQIEDVNSFLISLENFIEVGFLPTTLCMRIAFAYQKTMEKYPQFHFRQITKEDQERLNSFENSSSSSLLPCLSSHQMENFPSTVQLAEDRNHKKTLFVVFCQNNCPFRNGGTYKKISLAFDLYRHIFAARAATPIDSPQAPATIREIAFYNYLNRFGVQEVPELIGISNYSGKSGKRKIALFLPFLPRNLYQEIKESRIDRISVARSLTLGLSHIHALGIVHSDFKLNNILLEGEEPKIIDFGSSVKIGKFLRGGTSLYASPEFFKTQCDYSELAATQGIDLWSLGVILIELFRESLSPGYSKWHHDLYLETLSFEISLKEFYEKKCGCLYLPSISEPPPPICPIESIISSLLKINPQERISAFEAYERMNQFLTDDVDLLEDMS